MDKMNNNKKRIVLIIANVFLIFMLLLTFFSNTIINYSLPQVVTIKASAGKINNSEEFIGVAEHRSTITIRADAEKTIKEAEKRVKDQKAREACLDYLKIACKDYIYGLASDGRISQEDASMCFSLIDGIPSVTKATYTYSNLAHASINDFDNGDFHITPVEVDDLKRSIVSTDAQLTRVEEQIKTAEQEATHRIDDSHLFRAPEGYDRKRERTIHG